MSADRDASGTEAESELAQEALAFLHQARRQVRLLQPSEVERIACRLARREQSQRRVVLVPAVAAFGLVLAAGATLAVAKGGLRSLPIVGPFLEPLFVPTASTGASRASKLRRQTVSAPAIERPPVTSSSVPAVQPISAPTENAPAPTGELVRAPLPEPVATAGLATHPILPAHRRNVALGAPERPSRRAPAAQLQELSVPPPASEQKSPIAEESRSFASVIEPWHRTRDASTTLTLLDAHEGRYPHGVMQVESRVLRAEIYLAQGREHQALSVLDTMSLAGLPRARELHAVRGELRIKAGRCAEGRRDLDEVLAKGVADSLAKRAASAISHCP